jgi:hypothetical protein
MTLCFPLLGVKTDQAFYILKAKEECDKSDTPSWGRFAINQPS